MVEICLEESVPDSMSVIVGGSRSQQLTDSHSLLVAEVALA